MISEATVITKWSSRTKPSAFAPRPTTMFLEHTVIHIQASLPEDLSRVDPKCISLLDVVVQESSQKVVCRC